MLSLDRETGECFTIHVPGYAHEILVAVLRIRKGEVKLGIKAPREVAVMRPDMKNREPPARCGRQFDGEEKETGNERGS